MISTLSARWRERAEELRPYAASAAEAFARAAAELDAEMFAEANEELTLAEAVEVSGYSERRLRELAATGELENVGRKGAPRFRRSALPRKRRTEGAGYDPQRHADELVSRMRLSG